MASIQKRPDGSWRARYRDDEGREHSRHFKYKYAATPGAEDRRPGDSATEWLAEIASARLVGSYVDPRTSKVTVESFYADWSTRQVWAATTKVAMDITVRKCTFASVELVKLRRSHVETWVKAMVSDGLAPGTIRTRVNNIRSVLRAAARDRLMTGDPVDGVTLPRRRKAEHAMAIPTTEQVGRILEAAEPWFRPYVAVCAFAGLRLGEASALQVSDIDFLRRTLSVRRQVQRGHDDSTSLKSAVAIVPPKYGSERDVFVPDELLQLLSRHIDEVGVHGDERWLFVGDRGMPPHGNTIAYWWKKTLRAADVEGVKLHDLRHYFASGLIAAGCTVSTVQRALGHGSPAVTLNTYTHLWPSAEDHTRRAAGDLIRGALEAPADFSRTVGA